MKKEVNTTCVIFGQTLKSHDLTYGIQKLIRHYLSTLIRSEDSFTKDGAMRLFILSLLLFTLKRTRFTSLTTLDISTVYTSIVQNKKTFYVDVHVILSTHLVSTYIYIYIYRNIHSRAL